MQYRDGENTLTRRGAAASATLRERVRPAGCDPRFGGPGTGSLTQSRCDPLQAALTEGLVELGLAGSGPLPAALLDYLRELERWNRRFNLSGIRDPAAMVSRHLLDSLSIARWLDGERVLDVGSGAGLPGIPLALNAPQRRFDLLDANGKKARFLRHVVRTLGLANATVIERRLADYRPQDCYDTVVARAFAGIADLAPAVAHLTRPGGRLLVMRGRIEAPVPEPAGWRHGGTHRLKVPGLDAQRHVSIFERTAEATTWDG